MLRFLALFNNVTVLALQNKLSDTGLEIIHVSLGHVWKKMSSLNVISTGHEIQECTGMAKEKSGEVC